MDKFSDLNGTNWVGAAELWLDPMGDEVVRSACTMSVDGSTLSYTWSHEGQEHQGKFVLREEGADFSDSWHQPEGMTCQKSTGALGLFQVLGQYGPQLEWGWRTGLSFRTPTGELVLQMTNVAPWGEEVRAVRMICAPR